MPLHYRKRLCTLSNSLTAAPQAFVDTTRERRTHSGGSWESGFR